MGIDVNPVAAIVFGFITIALLLVAVRMAFSPDKTQYSQTAKTVVNALAVTLVVAIALGIGSLIFFGERLIDLARQVVGG
jgi:cytochrome bd-type quinol oxidase subunit 1